MKYSVEQRYYDNGYIDVYRREVPDTFKAIFHKLESYDLYIDVFDTEAEAEDFVKECKEVNDH